MVPTDTRMLSRRSLLAATGASLLATAGCLRSRGTDSANSGSTSSTGEPAPEGSWPQLGKDRAHSGYNPTVAGPGTPTEAWSVELEGPVTTPTVVGDTVYLTRGAPSEEGPHSTLEAYALADGSRQWSLPLQVEGQPVRFAFSAPYSNRRPVYYRGSLYVALDDRLTAVDVDAQTQVWTTSAYDQVSFNTPPTVSEAGVFAGGLEALVAFDFDGAEQWTYPSITTDGSGPEDATQGSGHIRVAAATADRVYASADSPVVALDPGDGAVRWKQTPEQPRSSTIVAAEDLLVRVGFRTVEARQPDGNRLWSAEWPGKATIRPAVDESSVYVAGLEGTVAAYNRQTGDRRWMTTLSPTEWAQGSIPVVTNDTVLVNRVSYEKRTGRVYGLHPESGEQRWQLETPATRVRGPVAARDHYVFTSEVTPESQRQSSTVSSGQDTTATLWAYQPTK